MTNRPPKRVRVVDGVIMHLRIPRDIHAKLMTMTREQKRTLNSLVVLTLTEKVHDQPAA